MEIVGIILLRVSMSPILIYYENKANKESMSRNEGAKTCLSVRFPYTTWKQRGNNHFPFFLGYLKVIYTLCILRQIILGLF